MIPLVTIEVAAWAAPYGPKSFWLWAGAFLCAGAVFGLAALFDWAEEYRGAKSWRQIAIFFIGLFALTMVVGNFITYLLIGGLAFYAVAYFIAYLGPEGPERRRQDE